MADIRSLLRSELASRGRAPAKGVSSKKRKASTEDTPDSRVSTAKKSRSVSSEAQAQAQALNQQRPKYAGPAQTHAPLPKRHSTHVASPPDLATVIEEEQELDEEGAAQAESVSEVQPGAKSTDIAGPTEGVAQEDVDEAEWAAFERDVATPPPEAQAQANARSALNAPASIEAQPLSAAELAAQATQEESNQRGKKDIEADEEREEAAIRLEEEFEEMEGLEERVRRLRERREMLRRGSKGEDAALITEAAEKSEATVVEEKEVEAKSEDEDEDADEDEDDEDWMWGRR